MPEKGMAFSAPLIRAILNTQPGVWPAVAVDGQKAFKFMTRRLAKHKAFYGEPDWDHGKDRA